MRHVLAGCCGLLAGWLIIAVLFWAGLLPEAKSWPQLAGMVTLLIAVWFLGYRSGEADGRR